MHGDEKGASVRVCFYENIRQNNERDHHTPAKVKTTVSPAAAVTVWGLNVNPPLPTSTSKLAACADEAQTTSIAERRVDFILVKLSESFD